MLTTLFILNIFNHAQPALLYLVPGVLISLWGTALLRNELSLMWGYTEDGSISLGPEGQNMGEKNDVDVKDEKTAAKKLKREKEDHIILFSLSQVIRKVKPENPAKID